MLLSLTSLPQILLIPNWGQITQSDAVFSRLQIYGADFHTCPGACPCFRVLLYRVESLLSFLLVPIPLYSWWWQPVVFLLVDVPMTLSQLLPFLALQRHLWNGEWFPPCTLKGKFTQWDLHTTERQQLCQWGWRDGPALSTGCPSRRLEFNSQLPKVVYNCLELQFQEIWHFPRNTYTININMYTFTNTYTSYAYTYIHIHSIPGAKAGFGICSYCFK